MNPFCSLTFLLLFLFFKVIAIMVKRESVTDLGVGRRKLLTEVEQLIMCGDLPRVQLIFKLLKYASYNGKT